jgi:hypothetical protein
LCSKPRKWPWLWQVSRGAARKMPGLQVAGSGEISGAPQDDRRISNVPLAAARGRQCVGSCWATRGGHRQGLENAIFTWDRPRGRWALCVSGPGKSKTKMVNTALQRTSDDLQVSKVSSPQGAAPVNVPGYKNRPAGLTQHATQQNHPPPTYTRPRISAITRPPRPAAPARASALFATPSVHVLHGTNQTMRRTHSHSTCVLSRCSLFLSLAHSLAVFLSSLCLRSRITRFHPQPSSASFAASYVQDGRSLGGDPLLCNSSLARCDRFGKLLQSVFI